MYAVRFRVCRNQLIGGLVPHPCVEFGRLVKHIRISGVALPQLRSCLQRRRSLLAARGTLQKCKARQPLQLTLGLASEVSLEHWERGLALLQIRLAEAKKQFRARSLRVDLKRSRKRLGCLG